MARVHHERIEQATGTKTNFADAHSPWQRGTNGNTNGLLRLYLPKGIDLTAISDRRLREVAEDSMTGLESACVTAHRTR